MRILGISAFAPGSSAALLSDGELEAAAQEERFTRTPRDEGFPHQAVRFCLESAGIQASDLDFIGFHEKPLTSFERSLETFLAFAPAGFGAFRRELPRWIGRRLFVARELDRGLGLRKKPYVFAEHHESHAAAAFYPSPFESAAILTVDAGGEWATTTLGQGRGNRIRLTHEMRHPHSVGLLYSAITAHLGFTVDGGERQVMDLAAHGEPRFVAPLLERVVDVKPDGSIWLDASYFRFAQGQTTTSPRFHALVGAAPRDPEAPITSAHRDLAASIQRVTEEILLRIVRHLHTLSPESNLVVSGSVAQNSAANGRIVREGPFANVWVQPASAVAGSALGVALLIQHQLLDRERRVTSSPRARSHAGPRYSMERIEALLRSQGARYEVVETAERDRRVADMLAQGQIVAWFQGHAEFGTHSLGARSLLADPRRADLQGTLDRKVRFQESFGPLTPAVLKERAPEWFDVPVGFDSPYRMIASRAHSSWHASRRGTGAENGTLAKGAAIPAIPAVTHVDGSSAVQTVDAALDPDLAGVLSAFERSTGCPVLVNAGFEQGAGPLVQSPEDAWRAFMQSEADVLVMENAIVIKAEQRAELEARRTDPSSGREQDPALEDLMRCPACGGSFDFEKERAKCKSCGAVHVREEGIWRLFHPNEPFDGDITEMVKGFYEEHPFPNYDEYDSLRSLIDKARMGIYARLLGEQIPFGARIIEVGCGTGQLSNFLGIGGRTVVGADLCLNSLRLAEKFRSKHGLRRVRFAQMNLFRPSFAPGSFDVVLCNGVLLTTSDPRGGFESIARLVKPGGHIVIGSYNTYGRLAVDSRRVFFRITGGRMRWVDPHLRGGKLSPEKEDAWFHDQYMHPNETKQTMGEVLSWFDRAGFEFVNAVPKTNPYEAFTEREQLFEAASRGSKLDRALAQAKMILTGNREGGFFVMIARKKVDA